MDAPISRRNFLNWVGAAGGSGAVYQVALALGLGSFKNSALAASPFQKMPSDGESFAITPLKNKNTTVVILGGGIAGLTAGYELARAGYQCTVLEASHRIGGRNLTLRHGDIVDEIGNLQRCQFDPDPALYFNAGPARIPANHTTVHAYCREFDIALEVFINENRNAWVQDDRANGGKPIRINQYMADTRGFLSELLAKKLVNTGDLEQSIDKLDIERLMEFVQTYGDLDKNHHYTGSPLRTGFAEGGIVQPGRKKDILAFSELLKTDFWRHPMHWSELETQAAPMMQPVGGMDKIVSGFARGLEAAGVTVVKNAVVKSIGLRDRGVDVVYTHKGGERRFSADYCLNNIPAHLLAGLDHNFPADYARALLVVKRGELFKIGLQAQERFWERERIYGGISWTGQDIAQIWYPSSGFNSKKGILLGAYTFDPRASRRFVRMNVEQRIEAALAQGEKIHPDYRRYIENGVTIAWHRMNHMLGCAPHWEEHLISDYFPRLQAPEGRHYMIGDQISFEPGWQEGAMRSALFAVKHIDHRVHSQSTS